MEYKNMNDSKKIEEKPWQLQTASDEDTFQKEAENFQRLVKEIEEMAGMITCLAKANSQFH